MFPKVVTQPQKQPLSAVTAIFGLPNKMLKKNYRIRFPSQINNQFMPVYQSPTLLLDENRCRRNISHMAEKAKLHHLRFRPHFKTHQSRAIGQWFREAGVDAITVSSLGMAAYFAPDWKDITVVFPTNILEMNRIEKLARDIQLNLLVESQEVATYLQEHLSHSVGIFLKIDVGYHRTGLSPTDQQQIESILTVLDQSPKLHFKGWLGHTGHTYSCRDTACIRSRHQQACEVMGTLQSTYGNRYPDAIVSLGDTPSCSVSDSFPHVDEIRPGNFVFYDLTQRHIGSNDCDQIAVAMACPIVAIHKDRNECVVYGGGVHFSKDRLVQRDNSLLWGQVVRSTATGWGTPIEGMYLRSLSQEHGIVKVPHEEIPKLRVGDTLLVLPVHSCMAVACMRQYRALDGKTISCWDGRSSDEGLLIQ